MARTPLIELSVLLKAVKKLSHVYSVEEVTGKLIDMLKPYPRTAQSVGVSPSVVRSGY